MVSRIVRAAPWVTLAGNVALLAGLARDAVLHREDPTLAAREGIFTFSNAGHVLFAIGIGLITFGMPLFLLGRFVTRPARPRLRRVVLVVPVAALIALAGLSFGAAVSSGSGLTGVHGHDHGDDEGHSHDDGASTAAESDHEQADEHEHDHGADAAATPTAEERVAADQLVVDTVASTARFVDFAVAEAEGYIQVTPDGPGPVGAAHFVSPAHVADRDYLAPERPESLVYLRTREGEFVLIGAMFLAPAGEGPRPGGPLTDWHSHPGACIAIPGPTPGIAMEDAAGRCPAGFIPIVNEMMHLWLFDNPDGPFAHELGIEGLRAAAEQLT